MKRAGRYLARTVLILIVIFGMLYFFQEKLIFRSSPLPQDYTYGFKSNFEEFFLEAEDGAILNGLHFKQEDPKGVILYCHGNAGGLDNWGFWAEELSGRYHYDVVVWDYRGYGKSTGKRRQNLMLNDGFLFYEYCKKYFEADNIVLYGRSLGGFFATHIAKNHKPKKLILESTPSSILKIAQKEYPFLPAKYLLKFNFQNNSNIQEIEAPTFIIHGTSDGLIPYENGESLFKLSSATTKKLYPIAGGDHNNLTAFKDEFYAALDEILK